MPLVVRQLGTSHDAHPYCSVRALHDHGHTAVPLLVRQLVVLRPSAAYDSEMHVIWCVRALRSISGKRFRFPTRRKTVRVHECTAYATSCPGRRVKSTGEPIPFFQERMSRGAMHLAPPDVQWRVINAWKAWVKKNGRTFTVQPYDDGGDWYW